jgi:hypothetical protein
VNRLKALRRGVCALHFDAIAALAGCSRTTVQNARCAKRTWRMRCLIPVGSERSFGGS